VSLLSLAEIGERKVIEIILNRLEKMSRLPLPLGDDVSAVELEDGGLAVLKTDMLVAKTDVPPGMSLWHAARKAVVMNVSDFAAKGVKPTAMLVSLGLPRGFTVEDIKQVVDGLNAGIREYGAYIVGGDTNEACDFIVACMLFGTVQRRKLVSRAGARPGDLVAVTGLFGNTSAGLKTLLENLKAPENIRKKLVNSVLTPEARLREGLALAETDAVTASIDSSDGLAWSLHEIARASDVGFHIDLLPISPEAQEFAEINKLDPVELCLYGGEEYELVVTVKPELWKTAEAAVRKVGGKLVKIGEVTKEREVLLHTRKKRVKIEARGWEHFKT